MSTVDNDPEPSPPMGGSARARRTPNWQLISTVALVWALAATVMVVWLSWRLMAGPAADSTAEAGTDPDVVAEPLPDRRVLRPVAYSELPGWQEDHQAAVLPAMARTCARFAFLGESTEVRPVEVGGRVADWSAVCDRIVALRRELDGADEATADQATRELFEQSFRPYQILNHDDETGLFTGYYEPLLHGSRRPTERYSVPLYRRPRDIVSVDLGSFREDLAGRRIAGRLDGDRLLPYHDRSEIVSGALGGKRLELIWVDDPVDAFFVQIQGSGQVELPDGSRMRIGYDGQNGHPYFAIGRELIDRGALTPENVSLQTIRAWLAENPQQAEEVMSTNPSFVFFRELKGDGPIGSQGVALTPGRSLAVDRSHLPLGAPVWLDATAPTADGPGDRALQRLLVAQDTGGAIRGPVRGDVFWGAGAEAEEVAGRMRHEGRLFLLLPTELVPTELPEAAGR